MIFLQLIDFIVDLEDNVAALHRKDMLVYVRVIQRMRLKVFWQFGLFEQTDQLGKVGIIAEP